METKNNFYASRKKKNPPDPHFYSYPKGFILNHETAREIFTLSESNEELRWNVTVGKPKKGDIAGEVGHKSGRISINGTRWRKDDVISIYLTGNPINRTVKCKDMDTYEKEWMKEIKVPKFPDWSYEWRKEKSRITAKAQYEGMDQDDRRRLWREKRNRKCKEKRRILGSLWRSKNKDRIKETQRLWIKNNPDKVKDIRRATRKDPKNKARLNLRSRFKDIMRTTKRGGSSSFSKIIGCTTNQLATHLESQFVRPMAWSNYGTYWHVDHIIPVSKFDHTDINQVQLCWHWANLRPMEAKANMSKGNTITHPQMSLLMPY